MVDVNKTASFTVIAAVVGFLLIGLTTFISINHFSKFEKINRRSSLTISTSRSHLLVGDNVKLNQKLFVLKPVKFQRISIIRNIEQIGVFDEQNEVFAYYDSPVAYERKSLSLETSFQSGESEKSKSLRFENPGVYVISVLYRWGDIEIKSNDLVIEVR